MPLGGIFSNNLIWKTSMNVAVPCFLLIVENGVFDIFSANMAQHIWNCLKLQRASHALYILHPDLPITVLTQNRDCRHGWNRAKH